MKKFLLMGLVFLVCSGLLTATKTYLSARTKFQPHQPESVSSISSLVPTLEKVVSFVTKEEKDQLEGLVSLQVTATQFSATESSGVLRLKNESAYAVCVQVFLRSEKISALSSQIVVSVLDTKMSVQEWLQTHASVMVKVDARSQKEVAFLFTEQLSTIEDITEHQTSFRFQALVLQSTSCAPP